GDLLAQGREYAHVHTGDAAGFVPNGANAWGAIYARGLVYVPDINSGLWVVKVEPQQPVIPSGVSMHLAVLSLLLQHHPAKPPNLPIATVEITPSAAEVAVGGSLQLAARAA